MELQRLELANEAMAEAVDLQRLFLEAVEAATFVAYSIPTAEGIFLTPAKCKEEQVKIRQKGFEGLSAGKWKKYTKKAPPEIVSILEFLEVAIGKYGRECRINDSVELQKILSRLHRFAPKVQTDVLVHLLGFTAVNQVFDRKGLRKVEGMEVRSMADVNLAREGQHIRDLVYLKMTNLLAKS